MKVGLIGCGGLGGAIARGLSAHVELQVFDRHPERIDAAAPGTGVPSAGHACDGRDVVLIAVKPMAVAGVLDSVRAFLPGGALVVSLAAGISLKTLSAQLPGLAVARAMPNIGVRLGVGTTGYVLGASAHAPRDASRIESIFGRLGTVSQLPREDLMHPVTAVGGSGPAFLLLALEALIEGGVQAGMPRDVARQFAAGALHAASALVGAGHSPEELRAAITSPGGTTAAGLFALEERAVRAAFQAAVVAATDRARALAGD
jgi:pyrroline-5-carboxylate reductase